MPLDLQQFLTAVQQDAETLALKQAPEGFSVCDSCNVPLQESVTGNRPTDDGSCRCSDCYFDAFSSELDNHPLGSLRVIRGA